MANENKVKTPAKTTGFFGPNAQAKLRPRLVMLPKTRGEYVGIGGSVKVRRTAQKMKYIKNPTESKGGVLYEVFPEASAEQYALLAPQLSTLIEEVQG